MKTILLLTALLTLAAFTSSTFAATTGRVVDSSIAGSEKLMSDSSGADTFILVSTLLAGQTFTSPTITGATITTSTYNGNTWTAGTGTLTLGTGKILTASNTLTLTGTDASSIAFGTGGTVAYQDGNLAQFASSTSAQLAGVLSNETGSGVAVFATSPTLVTPTIGVATATSVNKVALTAPATSATITIADGKTLTVNSSILLTGTDSTTFTFPATTATVMTSTLSSNDAQAANGVWGASNALVLEGATADAFETTLSPVDPTADQTVSIANAGVANALMFSTLTTNTVGAANSIWGASNSFVFEGATADTSEGTLTFADLTADVTYILPDVATGTYSAFLSTLATNAPDIANSVYGVSNGLMFEGATANAHEIRFTPADATADVVYLLPDAAAASYSLMSSTLATNAPNIADSVTGSSNALNFEGTADAHEITVTAADATGDVLYQLPDAPAGTYPVKANVVEARTVTAAGLTTGTISAGVTHVTVTSDDANKILILPAPVVGHQICIHGPATGFELRSSTPASIAINAGTGADAESAIPANSTLFLTCVTSTAWKGYYMDADGDVAKVEAAAP